MVSVGLDTRRVRCDRCLSMHAPRVMLHTTGGRFCSKVCATKAVIPLPRSAA